MYLLFYSLVSVWWVSADARCSSAEYATSSYALLESLGLFENKSLIKYVRPLVSYYDKVTVVYANLYLTSITDVNEKAQSISIQATIFMYWEADISWDSSNFCGIESFTAPKDLFWTPDIVVLESIQTEYAANTSPFMLVELAYSISTFTYLDILSLTTVCKMDLYSFPFDTQICNVTLQSLAHGDDKLRLSELSNSESLTIESQETFQTQGEWDLVHIKVSTTTYYNMGTPRTRITFQITIKRRPLLYIINFIFPVFCFLVLDVASYLINVSPADKLGFKVTLLLSISVLLLILNDKLPSTASKIPLVGIYCGGVFTMIAISILETIFVSILFAKEEIKSAASETSLDGTVTSRIEEPTHTVDRRKKASLYWTRAATIIDVTFLVIYIITVIVFLSVLGNMWFLL